MENQKYKILLISILMLFNVGMPLFAGGSWVPNNNPIDPIDPTEPLGGGPRDPYHPFPGNDPRNPFRNPNGNPNGPWTYDPWPNRNAGGPNLFDPCACNTAGKKSPKSRIRRVARGIGRGAGGLLFGYFWYYDFIEMYDDDQGVLVSGTMATFNTALSCHPIGAFIVWGNPYVSKEEYEARLRAQEFYRNPHLLGKQ